MRPLPPVQGLGDELVHLAHADLRLTMCGLPTRLGQAHQGPVSCAGCIAGHRRADQLLVAHGGHGLQAAVWMRVAGVALLLASANLDWVPIDPSETGGSVEVFARAVREAAVDADRARRESAAISPFTRRMTNTERN